MTGTKNALQRPLLLLYTFVPMALQVWKVIETFPEIPRHKTVFDGKSNAYAAEEIKTVDKKFVRKFELPDAGSSAKQGPSKAPAKGPGGGKGKGKGKGKETTEQPAQSAPIKSKNEFTVKIVCVAKIELEELHRFIRREGPLTSSCLTAIQGKLILDDG